MQMQVFSSLQWRARFGRRLGANFVGPIWLVASADLVFGRLFGESPSSLRTAMCKAMLEVILPRSPLEMAGNFGRMWIFEEARKTGIAPKQRFWGRRAGPFWQHFGDQVRNPVRL